MRFGRVDDSAGVGRGGGEGVRGVPRRCRWERELPWRGRRRRHLD